MEGKRFIHRLRLKNLLSFGPEGVDIELEPLNVLIGPNASGKSNFIEGISLLQAAPTNIAKPISDGGGISEWLWKGAGAGGVADLDAWVEYAEAPPGPSIVRHLLTLRANGHYAAVHNEFILRVGWGPVEQQGFPLLAHADDASGVEVLDQRSDPAQVFLIHGNIDPNQSFLSQRKDPDRFPEITYLGQQYARIQLYREWAVGRSAPPRTFQPADLPADVVLPDASNLALVLNALDNMPELGKPVIEELRRFHPRAARLSFFVMGGMIQVLLHEEGIETPVRATRLSDGTHHYLFLLAILHQPTPPPLVCIEEPELGLHPDIIPRVAELLVEASSRMQLVVTTHSSELVDALSDTPEAVVVCERDEGGTRLERLEPDKLREWLQEYTLGHLWMKGHLGGTL
jgi:predicted ATPase